MHTAAASSIVTMALLLASNAAMARDLPLLGGPGGGTTNLRCPAGQHLVGFQARSGLWVDAITIQCSGLLQVSERVRHTGISPGGSAGGGGGGLGRVTNCQEGTAVGSIGVNIFSDKTKMVRDISFGCVNRTVSGGGMRTVGNATSGTFPPTQSCARGEAAVGVNTRSGTYVDAIGLICDPINVRQAGPDNTDLCNAYADRMMKRVAEARQLNCRGWAFDTTRAGNLKQCLSYGAKAAQTITFSEGPFDAVLKACRDKGSAGSGSGSGATTPSCPANRGDPVPAAWADMLAAHNEKRKLHCACPLSWSASLASGAQAYATQCKLGIHGSKGENLATSVAVSNGVAKLPAKSNPQAFQDAWYSENKAYVFDSPQLVLEGASMNGHFTQVVWKGSTQLGCGIATCRMKVKMRYSDGREQEEVHDGTQWVCRYSPFGNDASQLREQVSAATCK